MEHREPGVQVLGLQETRPVRWAEAGPVGLEGHEEELGLHSESLGEPLRGFQQESGMMGLP